MTLTKFSFINYELFQNGSIVVFVWRNENGWPVESVTKNIASLYSQDPLLYTSGHLQYVNQIHPDDLATVIDEVTKASNNPQCASFEHKPYRYLDGDQNYRWVKDSTQIVRDKKGLITHYIGYIIDISDEINFHLKSQKYKERYELVLNALNDGVWDWNLVDDTVYFSPRWKEMIGYAEDEFPDSSSAFFDAIHPDDQPILDAIIKKHFEDPEKNVYSQEIRLRCRDGNYKWILARGKAYSDEEGKLVRMTGTHSDITEQKTGQLSLSQQKEEFETIFNISRDGIAILDLESNFLDFNASYLEMTGFTREELLATSCIALSIPEDRERAREAMEMALKKGFLDSFEKTCVVKNDKQITINMALSIMPDKKRVLISTKDITDVKAHAKKLEYIAHYDSLTGLPNRILKSDRLRQAMMQAQRRGEKVAVVYLDLDGFKEVNDQYGHATGDELLVELSKRMEHILREGDTLSRLGGDEFVAILVDIPRVSTAIPIIERLLESAQEVVFLNHHKLQVSASIGVTFYPQDSEVDGDQLIRQADQAMYEAKQAGKNRYHIFDSDHDRLIRTHHENVERIQQALHENEFILYYQPKIDMRSGAVVGAEALIRWLHPEKGLIPPLDFLPLIENHSLAVDIGEWVIDTAMTQIEQWHREGLEINVSVNVGARQLLQGDFVQRLNSIFARHAPFVSALLEIEVLETSALEDVQSAAKIIEECRAMNVHFALDDFGTGYSSLTYLKRLPVTTLKIDQSFVRDMLEDADNFAILEGIISLASAFNRKVIAEGVETIEHGEHLFKLGCNLAQGYGIARPMAAHLFVEWVRQWSNAPLIAFRS